MQLARILAESLQQVEFHKRKNKHLIQQMVARTRRGKTRMATRIGIITCNSFAGLNNAF